MLTGFSTPVIAALIGVVGTLIGAMVGWLLGRANQRRAEHHDRTRRNLLRLREALSRFLEVIEQDKWWEGYDRPWFDVVMCLGSLESGLKELDQTTKTILYSLPGRELSGRGPHELRVAVREAIGLVDRAIP